MGELLLRTYPWVLSLHVLSFVAWMAGLFYLPRLFVYHVERAAGDPGTEDLFQTMEYKLLRFIMNPAMIATWIFGLLLVAMPGIVNWGMAWPWTKAAAVIGMTVFHMWCAGERKALIDDPRHRTGRHYRAMNEVPTILLIVIVVSVIVKPL